LSGEDLDRLVGNEKGDRVVGSTIDNRGTVFLRFHDGLGLTAAKLSFFLLNGEDVDRVVGTTIDNRGTVFLRLQDGLGLTASK
jgi:hypothetical protein